MARTPQDRRTEALDALIRELTTEGWEIAAAQSRLTQRTGRLAEAWNRARPLILAQCRENGSGTPLQPERR